MTEIPEIPHANDDRWTKADLRYYLAASAGDDRARALMNAIERKLSAEQVKEAYRRADAWRAEL